MSNLSSIKNGNSTNIKVLEQFILHSNEDLIKEVFGSSPQLDTAAIFDSVVIDISRSNKMSGSAFPVVVPPQPVPLLEIRCTNDQRHSKAEPYILGSKNHSGNFEAIVESLAHFDPFRNIRSGKNMLAMKKLVVGLNTVCSEDDKSYEDDTVQLLNAFKKRGGKLLRRLDLELEIIKQTREELAAREQQILQERELINTFSFINS